MHAERLDGKGLLNTFELKPTVGGKLFFFLFGWFCFKNALVLPEGRFISGLICCFKKRIGLKTARSNLCSFRRNSLPCNEEVANLIKETESCIPRILCENSLPINSRPIKVDENSFSGRCWTNFWLADRLIMLNVMSSGCWPELHPQPTSLPWKKNKSCVSYFQWECGAH